MTNPRFKPGDRVHYSSVIGEPPVSTHTVREVRVSGDWHDFPLYTLSDKPGCVAEAALSPAESEWPPGHAAEFKSWIDSAYAAGMEAAAVIVRECAEPYTEGSGPCAALEAGACLDAVPRLLAQLDRSEQARRDAEAELERYIEMYRAERQARRDEQRRHRGELERLGSEFAKLREQLAALKAPADCPIEAGSPGEHSDETCPWCRGWRAGVSAGQRNDDLDERMAQEDQRTISQLREQLADRDSRLSEYADLVTEYRELEQDLREEVSEAWAAAKVRREQLALAVRALEAVVAIGCGCRPYLGACGCGDRMIEEAEDVLAQLRGETTAEPEPQAAGLRGCTARTDRGPRHVCQRAAGHEGLHYVGAHGASYEWGDASEVEP
jgi:hypothetical protein